MIADIFIKVLNLSIGAVPIMAALLALRILFKKAVPRKVFYIAWALVFLRLMVPFSFESDLSFFNHVPKAEVVEENIGTSVVFVENKNERVEFPVYINPENENPNVDWVYHSAITGEIVTGPDITTVPMDKNMILGTVWIFGSGGLLLFGIIGYFAVLKKLKFESIEYTDKIRLSEFFKTPVVCGLIRPKIILPMNFDLDDEAKVNSVIAHECTHIRRGDNFWRLLATFTLYVHWFNPLVWICYNAFIRDMEVSCDEEVLGKAGSDIRGEYAESLVALAGNGTNPLYGGVLSFGECAVKERVKCIMNFKKTTFLIVIICIAAAAALGVIFLTNPSATEEENIHDFKVVLAEGTEVSYSRENGIEMEAVITNNGENTIWIDSATIVQAEIDGEEKFAGAFGSGGVLMLKSGENALFCGNIPMESFEGNFAFNLPKGKYTLRRAVFFDEALTPTDVYAEYSFEIRESNSIETAEDIVAFAKENPDLLGLIENPAHYDNSISSYRSTTYWNRYKEANPGIPDVVVQFFYLYHSAFVHLEAPDFSELDKETGNFYKLEQFMKYQVARERIENGGDYVTDFELEIEKESGDVSAFVYSCKYSYEHKSGRKSGGIDTWKFVLTENPETGKEEIELFEWVQNGHGGLYPGLENIFDDIKMRYYPHHNEYYDLIANIGIAELMLENGYFENLNRPSMGTRIGDIVTFGNYNGTLEWIVIGEKEDRLLLITKDCIEALPYHNERKKITWADCDLREWLNEDFFEYAFSGEEKILVSGVVNENPDNKRFGGGTGGNKTSDLVFLLSHDEVLEYFPNGFNIYTEPAPSVDENLTKYEIDGREHWWWWTRSPGLGQDMATVVNGVTFGIGDDGLVVTEKHGVRPAMWIYKTREAAEEAMENAEVNPAIGYDFYGAVYNGKVPNGETVNGKYIPKESVLPKNVVWANEEQKKYCEDLLDSIDLGFADAFLVGDSSDGNTRVGIDMIHAENLYRIIKKAKLTVSEPTNPNTPAAKEIHIVMKSGDYVKIVWDTSYFTVYHKGQESAYRFDASEMKESFAEFLNLSSDYFIYGAGTLAQEYNSIDMEHLIPENTEPYVTLFSNASKTAATSYAAVNELRDLLNYQNLTINPSENISALGKAFSEVDVIEFIKKDDGSKYTLELYEKGFILKGSAVPEGKRGQQWIVEDDTWEYFTNKINTEFESADYKIPYWFGLVSPKRVTEVVVFGENGEKYRYTQNDDTFDNFFSIFRSDIWVSSVKERFEGNKMPEPVTDKFIRIKIYFATGTVYEIIAEENYITMVSSDMNYGLRYNLAEKADAYDAFLDYAEGGPINAVTG